MWSNRVLRVIYDHSLNFDHWSCPYEVSFSSSTNQKDLKLSQCLDVSDMTNDANRRKSWQ